MLMTQNYIFILTCLIIVLQYNKVNKFVSNIRTWMIQNILKINDFKQSFWL